MNFSGENAVSFFKYSNYIFTIVPKIMKKCYAIPEENAELTDGWMDRQAEGQTDNHDFVGPSVGWGSNYK